MSELRRAVYRGRISANQGDALFEQFQRLGAQSAVPEDLQRRVWTLAKERNLLDAYDAQYVAVVEALDCELWTTDRRLVASWHHDRVKETST